MDHVQNTVRASKEHHLVRYQLRRKIECNGQLCVEECWGLMCRRQSRDSGASVYHLRSCSQFRERERERSLPRIEGSLWVRVQDSCSTPVHIGTKTFGVVARELVLSSKKRQTNENLISSVHENDSCNTFVMYVELKYCWLMSSSCTPFLFLSISLVRDVSAIPPRAKANIART